MKRYSEAPFSIINFLFDLAEGSLVLRFVFKFLGANEGSWITSFLYTLTAPLVWPFSGIFPNTVVNGFTVEWPTVVAMIGYALLVLLVYRVVNLLVSFLTGEQHARPDEEFHAEHEPAGRPLHQRL